LTAAYASAAADIAGAFGEAFQAIGGENKSWVRATKIAMAAQALFSAYAASAQALVGPFPANIAAAAVILAKGLALVAAIKGAPIGFARGGQFMVGGSGGMDSVPVQFMATPGERVTVETLGQQRRDTMNINLQGENYSRRQVEALLEAINSAGRDGHLLRIQVASPFGA
jgi:hypothetical protein